MSAKATHTLAFCGETLCAAAELGQDAAAAVHDECPWDVAEAYDRDGFDIDVWLSNDLDDADCVYSGNALGWLPEDSDGRAYQYAYRAE